MFYPSSFISPSIDWTPNTNQHFSDARDPAIKQTDKALLLQTWQGKSTRMNEIILDVIK